MQKIKIKSLVYLILIFAGALLTTQACLIYVFHLPPYIQFFYLFLIFGGILCIFIPIKQSILSIDKTFFILYMLFILAMFISIIVNYNSVVSHGMDFTYYTLSYSKFWDRPDIRLFAWGIMRPAFFLAYTLLLFIFLNFKNGTKILLKTLIIVAILSSVYSIYQIISGYFGLPFGSIFSGHDGKEIFFFGKLRRVEGFFYEPGPHATILSPIFCILGLQIFEKDKKKLLFKRSITLIFFVLITIVLFLTFSPIGFLTPIIGIPIAILLNIKNIKLSKKLLKITAIALIVISIAAYLTSFIINSILTKTVNIDISITKYMIEKIANSTTALDDPIVYMNPDARSVRNYVGIKIFKDHILLGAGPSSAITYFYKYATFTGNNYILRDQGGVINTHIKILCETGIIGFTFYMGILIYPIWLYIKRYKLVKKDKKLIDSLLIAHFLYILLSFQSTQQFYSQYFWLIYIPLIVLLNKVKYNHFIVSTKDIKHESKNKTIDRHIIST